MVDARYELRRLIARGGMGLVFEAQHKFTRRTVALKLLPEDARARRQSCDRLLREAHALTTVRHPGFVEVLDAGVCGRQGPYVVLEMLEGRTLEGILAARRRLTVEDTVTLGRSVCDAAAHANARGVVHRDIKPSNVFVSRNQVGVEVVKIIDLGVAAVAEERVEGGRAPATTEEVIGTAEYMAPEQLLGRAIDARTDVYAIGVTLYECLTGEVPYTGTYPEVLALVSAAREPPRVRSKRSDAPTGVAMAIERALEKQAKARFQTAAELGRALAATGRSTVPSSLLSSAVEDAAAAPEGDGDDEPERAIQLVKRKKKDTSLRRSLVRAPYVTPVVVVSPTGSEINARSEEISEEGMLVVSPLSLPLGTSLRLRFASPTSGEMIAVSASVRWMRDGRGRTALGLDFVEAPGSVRNVIAAYVATLPAKQ
jgi:serine/threonine protein kinase